MKFTILEQICIEASGTCESSRSNATGNRSSSRRLLTRSCDHAHSGPFGVNSRTGAATEAQSEVLVKSICNCCPSGDLARALLLRCSKVSNDLSLDRPKCDLSSDGIHCPYSLQTYNQTILVESKGGLLSVCGSVPTGKEIITRLVRYGSEFYLSDECRFPLGLLGTFYPIRAVSYNAYEHLPYVITEALREVFRAD